jgi:DUF1365 family protein
MSRSPAPLASAVYEGWVRHRRYAPHAHAFRYRMAQLYIDLAELDRLFAGRWLWSVGRRNLAEFRRSDYLGPTEQPLEEAVRARVAAVTGQRPAGPIRMLTHLRYGGYSFNPVTFYYCFAGPDEDEPETIVAEITNTPWRERHAYVLDRPTATRSGRTLGWQFAKDFHVSPFMPMEREYLWRFTPPAEELQVHMQVLRGQALEFDATLQLKRRALNAAALRRVLWRYPLMSAQVSGAILWQALRLRLKRNPFYDHPKGSTAHEA